ASPALTRCSGSRIVRPPTVTSPARISALTRERDRSATRAVSTRSRRLAVAAAAATGVFRGGGRWGSNEPLAGDDKPLDPAAAKIVARVRWLMLISGVTTFVGVAAILGVIGYRMFRAEGSAAPADVTALLPKGARIVSTTVGEDRIAVTLEVGGA